MGCIMYLTDMFYNFHQDKVVVVSQKFKSVAIYEQKERVINSYVPTLVYNLKTLYQATDVDKVLTELIRQHQSKPFQLNHSTVKQNCSVRN
jgi:hypothetical protein